MIAICASTIQFKQLYNQAVQALKYTPKIKYFEKVSYQASWATQGLEAKEFLLESHDLSV